jgi:hypothetical protein
LLGNSTLYRPAGLHWSLLAGLRRREQPLMDRGGMWRWLQAELEGSARPGPTTRCCACRRIAELSAKGHALAAAAWEAWAERPAPACARTVA